MISQKERKKEREVGVTQHEAKGEEKYVKTTKNTANI